MVGRDDSNKIILSCRAFCSIEKRLNVEVAVASQRTTFGHTKRRSGGSCSWVRNPDDGNSRAHLGELLKVHG